MSKKRNDKKRKTKVEHADIAVLEATSDLRHTPPVKLLGTLSEVADQPQLISICAATLAAGLLMRRPKLAVAGARMLATELLATKMKSAVKHRIDRTRPRVIDDGGDYEMKRGKTKSSEMNSFPSGHTAGAVGVARALARSYPDLATPAYATAGAIAVIQIPRCQHYPSDLAAGAAVGLAAELVVDRVWNGVAALFRATAAPRAVRG
jgi:membrane-associated phospholipid phosphatase